MHYSQSKTHLIFFIFFPVNFPSSASMRSETKKNKTKQKVTPPTHHPNTHAYIQARTHSDVLFENNWINCP